METGAFLVCVLLSWAVIEWPTIRRAYRAAMRIRESDIPRLMECGYSLREIEERMDMEEFRTTMHDAW